MRAHEDKTKSLNHTPRKFEPHTPRSSVADEAEITKEINGVLAEEIEPMDAPGSPDSNASFCDFANRKQ